MRPRGDVPAPRSCSRKVTLPNSPRFISLATLITSSRNTTSSSSRIRRETAKISPASLRSESNAGRPRSRFRRSKRPSRQSARSFIQSRSENPAVPSLNRSRAELGASLFDIPEGLTVDNSGPPRDSPAGLRESPFRETTPSSSDVVRSRLSHPPNRTQAIKKAAQAATDTRSVLTLLTAPLMRRGPDKRAPRKTDKARHTQPGLRCIPPAQNVSVEPAVPRHVPSLSNHIVVIWMVSPLSKLLLFSPSPLPSGKQF